MPNYPSTQNSLFFIGYLAQPQVLGFLYLYACSQLNGDLN